MSKTLRVFGVFFICCGMGLMSCRPVADVFAINSDAGTTGNPTYYTASNAYADIFTAFWYGMSDNYVYWNLEPDGYWDEVWDTYYERFAALGDFTPQAYNGKNTEMQAYRYIQDIVSPLHDGHWHITIAFADNDTRIINPNTARIDARPRNRNRSAVSCPDITFHNNMWTQTDNANAEGWDFWQEVLKPHYIRNNESARSVKNIESSILHVATGDITAERTPTLSDGFLCYIHFNTFRLTKAISNAMTSALVSNVWNTFLDTVRNSECKGVIIDLRGNNGGDVPDIPLLMSPLISEPLTFVEYRGKKSSLPLDYLPWMPYTLEPAPAAYRAANAGGLAIVAIVDDYSISCAELTALAVRESGGYIVGTRTSGALGTSFDVENGTSPVVLSSGGFSHNKFWTTVGEQGYQTRAMNGEFYDSVGVPPDEVVEFNRTNFAAGIDDQLDAAIAAACRRITTGSYR
jgi:hypothetical protein